MNIRCKHCGEYFCPCEETLDLMAEGHIYANSVNCCDECWEMLKYSECDQIDTYSDADPCL